MRPLGRLSSQSFTYKRQSGEAVKVASFNVSSFVPWYPSKSGLRHKHTVKHTVPRYHVSFLLLWYPSKSGLMHKHIVKQTYPSKSHKHTVKHTVLTNAQTYREERRTTGCQPRPDFASCLLCRWHKSSRRLNARILTALFSQVLSAFSPCGLIRGSADAPVVPQQDIPKVCWE
jgi:hypothetical protein